VIFTAPAGHLPLDSLDPHLRLRPRADCAGTLDCNLSAFRLPEFSAGLWAAGLAVAGGLVIAGVYRRSGTRAPAPVGALLVLTAAMAYQYTGHLLPRLAAGLVLLLLGGLIADKAVPSLLGRALLLVPGAAVLATMPALEPLVPIWVLCLMGLATAVGGALAADADEHAARFGAGPVCMAVTVVGVYFTVPDTDLALVLLPLIPAVALLAWPVALTRLGTGGSAGVVGLLLFVVVVGGRGRLSAVVGGAACLSLLVAEPIARALRRGRSVLDRLPSTPAAGVVIGLAQLGVVSVESRVAGLRPDVVSAAVIAGGTLLAAVVTLMVLIPDDAPTRRV
jgi:hypothetical protein